MLIKSLGGLVVLLVINLLFNILKFYLFYLKSSMYIFEKFESDDILNIFQSDTLLFLHPYTPCVCLCQCESDFAKIGVVGV